MGVSMGLHTELCATEQIPTDSFDIHHFYCLFHVTLCWTDHLPLTAPRQKTNGKDFLTEKAATIKINICALLIIIKSLYMH